MKYRNQTADSKQLKSEILQVPHYPKSEILHAPRNLQYLAHILLHYPHDRHEELSSTMTYLQPQPARRFRSGLANLICTGQDEAVVLGFTTTREKSAHLHRLTFVEDGEHIYHNEAVDLSSSRGHDFLHLRGREIATNEYVAHQLAFLLPLVIAAANVRGVVHNPLAA